MGVFRINWYPLGSRSLSHRPIVTILILGRHTRGTPLSVLPPTMRCSTRPSPSLATRPSTPFVVGFGEKKRAGIFLSILPGSLFFTLFLFFIFSISLSPTLCSGGVRVFFVVPLLPAGASCPDTAIFFIQDRWRRRLADRRDLQG